MKKQFLIPILFWGGLLVVVLIYWGTKELLKDKPEATALSYISTDEVYEYLEEPTFIREWESAFQKVHLHSWEATHRGRWAAVFREGSEANNHRSIQFYLRKYNLEEAVEIQANAQDEAKRLQPSTRIKNLHDRQKLIEYDWEPFTVLPDGYIQETYLVCGLGDKEECDWWYYSGRYGQYVVVIMFNAFQAGISLDEFETIYSEIDRAIALTFQEAGAFEE